jgi:hypothetical protein
MLVLLGSIGINNLVIFMKEGKYKKITVLGVLLFLVIGFISNINAYRDNYIHIDYREGTAHMGFVPSSDTVIIGDDFTVSVYIDPSEAVGGWEIFLLTFTQGIVNATKVSWEATIYDSHNFLNYCLIAKV